MRRASEWTIRGIIGIGLLVPAGDARAQGAAPGISPDTQPRAVVVSEWHSRRLAIHRVTAYTIPPLFAAQYLLGRELYRGTDADWVRPTHRAGAMLIGTAFAINATTGAMNLWASRHEPEDRVLRFLHGGSMLAAAAGFTYAGVRLAEQAETSLDKRREHRRVALASMGLTLVSGTVMWWSNR